MKLNSQELPHVVVAALMQVHHHVGVGLNLDAYKACLAHEFRMQELVFRQNVPGTIEYKGHDLPAAFTMDFVVENAIVLSLYTVDDLLPSHRYKLKNQLFMTGLETGFLVNFNAPDLRKGGLKRLIVSSEEPDMPWKSADDEKPREAPSTDEWN